MQNNQNFSQKLENLLIQKLGIEDGHLNLQAHLQRDLGMSEIEIADLVSFIETELKVNIDDKSAIASLNTLEDLVHLIEENSHEF
ncbi:hypothetical protein A2773_00985 [Candidatus Gottesmanbacteria bacterium RIFCSPHIGHO2_01_FULL_39_10]|uniref:Carrier domain-containing protein n=1 Tax=Candidatus Gottesmanbacteria bacterium RIFCSPHIGHO2_01_FULL_39_10 TaxID=1798375 RepID=A0A1F5ZLP5_9BACT|nr:MAG: hypothetical protein A2773_00985 [Candidatus Gottesmanbacteria bacterium RIFCSPHIGHO2_01_FULL_39_10]